MEEGTHDYGHPRTAHDRRALQGEADFIPGGNPTPDESTLQAAYWAAVRRDNMPTVAEMAAAYPMEVAPDGAHVPGKLTGRIDGWVGDRSHVEGQSERLKALFDRMQEHADAVTEAIRTGERSASLTGHAVAMRNLWNRVAKELEQ
jgi:hypothetical protein